MSGPKVLGAAALGPLAPFALGGADAFGKATKVEKIDDSAVKADLKERKRQLKVRADADQRRQLGGISDFISTGPMGRAGTSGGLADVLGV